MPTVDGLSPSCVALPPGPWPTVLDFFCERFAQVSRADWVARMQAGKVVDAQGAVVTPERAYAKELRVWYYRERDDETPIAAQAQVLFQDEWLVVADKPHFLPVIPSGRHVRETLLVRLKHQLGIDTLTPIHRIDRETAGVVAFAVQPATRGAYQRLFEQRAVRKQYEAIVHWPPRYPLPAVYRSRMESVFMRSEEVAGEPNSETALELLEVRDALARLALRPTTGRKHQLRVHCCALGMPILGDGIYPTLRAEGDDDLSQPLQLLASTLAFTDPVTGAERQFSSRQALTFPSAMPVRPMP
ncbi:MAG: pseudouridine synthase [Comamonadaceae bacterium]|nr:MAG: pseudouridine synthase [Comamonadaceae bacterium]